VHWKIIIISIWLLKPMPTTVNKECTQKNYYYYFHKFIYFYLLLGKPLVLTQWNYFLGYFIMFSPMCNSAHKKMEIFSCTLLCAFQNTKYNMKLQWPPILMIHEVWFIVILLHCASILSLILYFNQIKDHNFVSIAFYK
jgi:hypothetical protein